MTENTPLKINTGFRLQWEPAQESHVLLYPEGMVKLSSAAAEILGLVDGQRSLIDITHLLSEKFPEADLAEDVKEFVEVAITKGWIS